MEDISKLTGKITSNTTNNTHNNNTINNQNKMINGPMSLSQIQMFRRLYNNTYKCKKCK